MEPEAARGKDIEVEARDEKDGREATPSPSHTPEPVEIKSPPAQTIPGYDPNRIPSSIFSSSPGDWSGASNESLFSIQMGNNSFSKDYAILFGKPPDFDLNQPECNPFKSGDLPRLDDWSNRSTDQSSSLPPVMEAPSREDSRWQSPAPAKPNPSLRVSDASGHSNMSFAFPVLVSESARTDYSVRVAPEKSKAVEKPPPTETIAPPQPQTMLQSQLQSQSQRQPQPQPQYKVGAHPPKKWFSCFTCSWPRFC